ncbi:MAG: Rrf2 family transcriptional regulator [Elusimicrobia bacterium]|nr:Rrf2 family transcriptional regulator [Elusimicrobiota bacterium]
MKLFNKNTDYAARALMYLSKEKNRFISSTEISNAVMIPLFYVRRILQKLAKNGIVISREGIAGGVKLKKKPEVIRILDLIKIFQGDIKISECMFRKKICANRSKCVLRTEIKKIEKMVEHKFSNMTIKKLAP